MKSKTGFDLSLGNIILYLYSFSTSSKCQSRKKSASWATFFRWIRFHLILLRGRNSANLLTQFMCSWLFCGTKPWSFQNLNKSLQENTKHPKGGNTERQIQKSEIGNTKWLCALMTRLLKRQNVEGCWLSRLRLLNFQLSKPIYNFNFWFSFIKTNTQFQFLIFFYLNQYTISLFDFL